CGCAGYSPYAPLHSAPVAPMPPAGPEGGKKVDGEVRLDSKARLIVEVPASAQLYIDDQPMKTVAATRTFTTPALEKGQTYYYELKVEVARDGVTHRETRKVLIRA